MCQVFPCASHFTLQHSVWFDLIFQPYHLFLLPTNTHTSIFFCTFVLFPSCLSHWFLFLPPLVCHSATQIYTQRIPLRYRHPKWNQAEPPSGFMSHFLARQYMTILPPWDWRTSGTEQHSAGHKIPLKEQMLASSWHMPLRYSRVWGDVMEGKAEDNRGRGWRRESFTVEEQWGSWKGRKGRLRLEKCKSKAKTQKKNLRANLIVNNTPIILNSKAILPQVCQSSLRPISMSA